MTSLPASLVDPGVTWPALWPPHWTTFSSPAAGGGGLWLQFRLKKARWNVPYNRMRWDNVSRFLNHNVILGLIHSWLHYVHFKPNYNKYPLTPMDRATSYIKLDAECDQQVTVVVDCWHDGHVHRCRQMSTQTVRISPEIFGIELLRSL